MATRKKILSHLEIHLKGLNYIFTGLIQNTEDRASIEVDWGENPVDETVNAVIAAYDWSPIQYETIDEKIAKLEADVANLKSR